MTAFEIIDALDDEQPVWLALGSGEEIKVSAGALRVLMGRWGTMDNTEVILVQERRQDVAYASCSDDWLFAYDREPHNDPR